MTKQVCVLIAAIACVVYAAPAASIETNESLSTAISPEKASGLIASVWGGLGIAGRESSGDALVAGPSLGGTLTFAQNWGLPLRVGVDAGLSTSSHSLDEVRTTNRVKVHILPTAYYRFEDFQFLSGDVYLGASVGPVLYWQRNIGPGPRTYTRPDLGLAVLARPGISFRLGREIAMGVELPLGVSAGDWIASAQLKFSFSLEAGRNSVGATQTN